MGAEVVAISHSPSKQEESVQLGAKHFLDISDEESCKLFSRRLNLLLITSNHEDQPWLKYMSFLKPHGTLVLLAVPEKPISFYTFPLAMQELSISGSLIASRQVIQEMLEFAAKHKVLPWIHKMPMSKVNEALQIVRDGKPRYRIVMETQTI